MCNWFSICETMILERKLKSLISSLKRNKLNYSVGEDEDNLVVTQKKRKTKGLFGFVGFHYSSPYFHPSSPKISGSHKEGACLDGFWGFVSITQFSPNRVMSYWKQKQVLGVFEVQKQSNGWQLRKYPHISGPHGQRRVKSTAPFCTPHQWL